MKCDLNFIAASGAEGRLSFPESLTLDLSSGFVLEELWWKGCRGELSNASNPEHRSGAGCGWLRVRWQLQGTSESPGSQIPARKRAEA